MKNNILTKERQCHFCQNGIKDIDYKEGTLLRKFTSSYAKIVPRRRSKLCAKHQRKTAEAIKRARFMAILPFVNR
ncbi:30S ribosomal protein S18 [Candidatus Kuenenbacteria bacterium]|nr:30S ribosomal protein S18 [Candidatus Kuenenbacteria bacterium]